MFMQDFVLKTSSLSQTEPRQYPQSRRILTDSNQTSLSMVFLTLFPIAQWFLGFPVV